IMFLAVDANGIALGFSTLYFTFSSTSACKISILNDLYVDENLKMASGIRTIGFSLIRHCFDYSLHQKIFKIVGTTDFDNFRAQRLYDTLPYRIKDFTIEKNNVFEYVVKYLGH